jgi:hypothetical protein
VFVDRENLLKNSDISKTMSHLSHIALIAKKLGLSFGEEDIGIMLKLLEGGVTPDNLVKILEEVKEAIKNYNVSTKYME